MSDPPLSSSVSEAARLDGEGIDLEPIKERVYRKLWHHAAVDWSNRSDTVDEVMQVVEEDVPALIAEVERFRAHAAIYRGALEKIVEGLRCSCVLCDACIATECLACIAQRALDEAEK